MTVQIPKKYIEKEIAKYKSDIAVKKTKTVEAPKKVITMSCQSGTAGRQIADVLGKKLGCTVWDREILDVLAGQSGWNYQSQMFEALDEKTQSAIDSLVDEFFGHVDKYTYQNLLPKAIYVIAQNNAIIIGRGAFLLLPGSFRVHITASFETRVSYMVTSQGMPEKEAREALKKADRQREAFLKEIATNTGGKNDSTAFDMILNTDRFTVSDAAALVLQGFSFHYAAL